MLATGSTYGLNLWTKPKNLPAGQIFVEPGDLKAAAGCPVCLLVYCMLAIGIGSTLPKNMVTIKRNNCQNGSAKTAAANLAAAKTAVSVGTQIALNFHYRAGLKS